MVQIAGKYKFSSSENVPARGDRPGRPDGDHVIEITVEGSKYSFIRGNRTTVYEDGKETESKTPKGDTIKHKAKVSGATLEIETTFTDGKTRKATYVFSDDGYTETFQHSEGEGKLIFKRV